MGRYGSYPTPGQPSQPQPTPAPPSGGQGGGTPPPQQPPAPPQNGGPSQGPQPPQGGGQAAQSQQQPAAPSAAPSAHEKATRPSEILNWINLGANIILMCLIGWVPILGLAVGVASATLSTVQLLRGNEFNKHAAEGGRVRLWPFGVALAINGLIMLADGFYTIGTLISVYDM